MENPFQSRTTSEGNQGCDRMPEKSAKSGDGHSTSTSKSSSHQCVTKGSSLTQQQPPPLSVAYLKEQQHGNEIGRNGDGDSTISQQEFEQRWWPLLFFRNSELEVQFLVEEYYRCRWRLFLNTFVWMFLSLVYRYVRPSVTFIAVPLAMSSGVASLLQLLVIAFDKFFIEPEEKRYTSLADNGHHSRHHRHEKKGQPEQFEAIICTLHQQAAREEEEGMARPSTRSKNIPQKSVSKTHNLDTNEINEDKSPQVVHPLRTKQAYLQEGLASVWTVFQGVFLTYLMSEVQTLSTCLFLLRHDGDDGDDHWTFLDRESGASCPFRINQYLYWTTFIPIVVGQPRFHIVAFGYCVTFITAIATQNVHDVSPGGQVILLVLFALYLVMLTVLKYFNEVQLRKRFVLRKLTDEHRRQAEWGNRALKEFVLQITPKHLHTKLREASGVLTADASTNATCVVVQIHDSLAFIHSVLPTKAAAYFSILFLFAERNAQLVGLEHIRTHGDTSILVSNLAPARDVQDAAVGDDEKEANELAMLFQFALSLHQLGRQRHDAMNVVCGIAQGTLVGMPLGSSCIHYDLFGPALSRATMLAASCEPTKIHVDETMCQTLEETRRVEVQGRPSEIHQELRQPSMVVTKSRMVGGLKTVADAQDHSTFTVSMQSIDDDDDLDSFDAIAALALRGSQHLHPTSVAIQTTDTQPLLKITKSCCFVSEFSDPDVQEQATKCIQQDTTFSFFLVNVFMALFLAVCCASVAEERGSKADEDLAPLLVYFILTTLCIVVFSVLALLAWKEHRAAQPRHRLRGICLVTMFVSLVACHFPRRSAVGDDPGFLLYVVCLLAMHIGVSAKTLIAFELVCFLIGYYTLIFTWKPLVVYGHSLTIFAVLVIVNSTLVNNEVDMTLHAQLLASEAAIAEVREQEQIQQRILASIIPPGLHYVFEDPISMFNVNRNRFDCWGEDEAVVLHLNFVMPDLEKVLATEENTSGYSEVVPPSIFTPSVVQAIKRSAEETSGLIERLVANVQHKSLNVVKVLGGTMVVAGPIINSEKLKASSTRDLDELRLLVEQCIEDAVELVATLFKESGLVTKPTVGVALEQTIDCLIVNNKPSFDLLGQAVNLAKGIADAAPAAGMAVATEKFVSRAEALPSCNNAISFGSGESWRLRNLGSVRVRSVHT